MSNVVVFNKSGYDPFIDFIKAYAIICVLIGHTFPYLDYIGYGLWVGMQVPLFVLVQVFHNLKKDTSVVNIKKIFWRVFFPFILVELGIFSIQLWIYHYDINTLLKNWLRWGGAGPGSYYPWVYAQIALLLPLLKKWMQNFSKLQLAMVFIAMCEGFEFVLSVIDFPDWLYRLLAIRYLFLIYLAWIWVENEIELNSKVITLSILSFLSVIYFGYYSVNDEPIFYNTAWKTHRWPCFYYVAFGGTFLLYMLWRGISKNHFIKSTVKMLAKCSYEIFLVQMAVCATFPALSFITNGVLHIITKILLIFTISIIGGYVFNRYYESLVLKKTIRNG